MNSFNSAANACSPDIPAGGFTEEKKAMDAKAIALETVAALEQGQYTAPDGVDFITSPAPNAGAIWQNEPANRQFIVPVLTERASKILALAASQQCDALVLGAWGCGVFRNDPSTVAAIFHDYLRPQGRYSGCFRHILFSVYDASRPPETSGAFVHQFADLV
jgi:uncharacterized protein (TIGR02452 family)